MDLSVLIVTYNSGSLIASLLEELYQSFAHDALNAEVVLVDNASQDESVTRIKRDFPWVRLIASRVNRGFAAANNLAAQHARGRVLLLLNPDAIPAPGSLRQGIEMLDAHPEVGLAGGQLFSPDGKPQPSARMFPHLSDEFFMLSGLAARFPASRLFGRLDRGWADPNQTAAVDWIPGAFVFLPAAQFRRLGGFDERFFMYYEEVDLCRRLRAAGLEVRYWPALKAVHIGGASARTLSQQRVSSSGAQLESWRMRSGLLYYHKHHGAIGATGLHWLERSWHALREFKARLQGRLEQAADFALHGHQLQQAWRDTQGGSHSPIKPW